MTMKLLVITFLTAFATAQQPIPVDPTHPDPCPTSGAPFETFHVSGIPGQATAEFREAGRVIFVDGRPTNYYANRHSNDERDDSQQFRVAKCIGQNGAQNSFEVWTVTHAKADDIWDPCKSIIAQQALNWWGPAPSPVPSPDQVQTWQSTHGNLVISFTQFNCSSLGFNDIDPNNFLAKAGFIANTLANQVGLDNGPATDIERHFEHITEAIGDCLTIDACNSFSFFVPGYVEGSQANAIVTEETPGNFLVQVQPARSLIAIRHNTRGVASNPGAGEEILSTFPQNGFTVNMPTSKKELNLLRRYCTKSGMTVEQVSKIASDAPGSTAHSYTSAIALGIGGVVCGVVAASVRSRRNHVPLSEEDATPAVI